VVEPMHSKYIEPTKKSANIIVSNDYNPNIEAKNSEVKESNLKFELQEDLILKLDEIIYKL
jgi:uridine kinase